MSYTDALRDIDRSTVQGSITGRIVEAIRAAIERGDLPPGERLLPTRELADLAGINHLTAVRAYKRLRELGYVHAKVGSGTYVRDLRARVAAAEAPETAAWQRYVLPDGVRASDDVLMRAMGAADQDDVVQMALGYAPLEVLPVDAWQQHLQAALEDLGPLALQYLPPEGSPFLRRELARLAGDGERAEDIIATSGATQAVNLAVRAIVRSGDAIAVEAPTFAGSLESARASGAAVHGVASDEDGLDVDALEALLSRHPVRLVILQSALQNPTGASLAEDRARRLVALARRHGFFVLDDEVWAATRAGDPAPMAELRARDRTHVIAAGSASKVAGGGLRLGWLRASGPVFERLLIEKRRDDLVSATIVQHAAARWISSGGYEQQAARMRAAYAERRAAFEAAASRHLTGLASFPRAAGGASTWLRALAPMDEHALVAAAERAGVAVLPGSAFTVDPPSRAHLRVAYSMIGPDRIEEGVRRLAAALRSAAANRRASATLPVL
jgi:2-aminoadipate transaminase